MKEKHFYLTPGERTGFLTLTLLILLSHSGILIYEKIFGYTQHEKNLIIRHLISQDSINQANSAWGIEQLLLPIEVLQSFDPNSIETQHLRYYGFSTDVLSNLEKYRASGGAFYYKEDLLKIYDIDTNQFYKIYSLIKLPAKESKIQFSDETNTSSGESIRRNTRTVAQPPLPQQPFDPNSADQQTLEDYGLSDFAIDNLNKYRTRGGRILKDSDLLKIYGVDTQLFRRISPLISIANHEENTPSIDLDSSSNLTDSVYPDHPIQINLNKATAEELRSIKGIGPYISKAIIEYRKELGGYHSIEQLREVYALRESTFQQIKDHLLINSPVQKIYAPDYTFKDLLKHPYIDYSTTQVLKNIPMTEYDKQIIILIKEGLIEQQLIPYLHLEDPHK